MNRMNNCNYRSNVQSRYESANSCAVRNRNDMLEGLPLAMAYVPMQHYDRMFDLGKGLKMGTIFPELCLPFCGVRRGCACRTMK